MNRYIVFLPKAGNTLPEAFPGTHYRISDDWWAIGTPLATASDVCDALGVDEGPGRTMVVVPITDYYGRFDVALWQKLSAWNRS